MFDFMACREYLESQIDHMKTIGFMIEGGRFASESCQTVRYRFEGKRALGEIMVWDWGASSLLLYDLSRQLNGQTAQDTIPVYVKDGTFFEDNGAEQMKPFLEMAIKLG